jgi:hypothetical protein
MSQLLLIILQVISALPEIIAMVEKLIEMIRGIRDRKTRLAMRKKLRQAILKRKNIKTMSSEDNRDLMSEIQKLYSEVSVILHQEGV